MKSIHSVLWHRDRRRGKEEGAIWKS